MRIGLAYMYYPKYILKLTGVYDMQSFLYMVLILCFFDRFMKKTGGFMK